MPRKFEKPPAFIAPQAPTLTAEPPSEAGWIHEIKHDGYRTLLRLERRSFQAFSRNGYDWTQNIGLSLMPAGGCIATQP